MAGGTQDDDEGLISAINVTPLVDVVLVLLIIFMVTARIIHSQAIPMDLPKTSTGEQIQTVFSVELGAEGQAFVDSEKLPEDAAIYGLAQKARKDNPDIRAVIRADKKVPHGRVIGVLDMLKRAEIAKIAFAVSPGAPDETSVETDTR